MQSFALVAGRANVETKQLPTCIARRFSFRPPFFLRLDLVPLSCLQRLPHRVPHLRNRRRTATLASFSRAPSCHEKRVERQAERSMFSLISPLLLRSLLHDVWWRVMLIKLVLVRLVELVCFLFVFLGVRFDSPVCVCARVCAHACMKPCAPKEVVGLAQCCPGLAPQPSCV
jgi:hypothetical protein